MQAIWQKMRTILCVLAVCLTLSGCAVRGTSDKDVPDVPPVPTFTEQVAALPNGVAQPFEQSPYGAVLITAGSPYVSGLGNQCRPIRITQGSMQYKAAVCQQEDGEWRIIPTIFDCMPR